MRLPARAELAPKPRRRVRGDPPPLGDRHRRLPDRRRRRAALYPLAHALDSAAPSVPTRPRPARAHRSGIDRRREHMKLRLGIVVALAAALVAAAAGVTA